MGLLVEGSAQRMRGRKVAVQCMAEEQVLVFNWNAQRLAPAGTVKTTGGPAGIRTAEK